jgi:hypothetical protein
MKDYSTMKKSMFLMTGAAVVVLAVLVSIPVRRAQGQDALSAEVATDFVAPIVFQAAGPSVASIQNSIAEYRIALGDQNKDADGPKDAGRREINWDGPAGNLDTAIGANPFRNFLNTRGALISTPDGSGFVQATPDGLAALFGNPTYATILRAFSRFRLFSAIGGRITEVDFFRPGGGDIPATTKGFGVVFTDVDQPDGSGPGGKRGNRKSSTLIEYFGINGELLFSSFVPASPGDGNQSFFGVVFPDARIARVRITSGDVALGPDDTAKQDVVAMDDFIYGEPVQR